MLDAYGYSITYQPTDCILTLNEAKEHLRLDTSDVSQNTYLQALIKAATRYIESYTGRELLTKYFKAYTDCLPDACYDGLTNSNLVYYNETNIRILRSKLQTIESIKYYLDNVLAVFNSADYYFTDDTNFSTINVYDNKNFPSDIDIKKQAVVIEFSAGYGLKVLSSIRNTDVTTIITELNHGFSTGDTIQITGANDSAMNGKFSITKIDDTSFSYANDGDDATATGKINAHKIPEDILLAAKMIVARFYENRGDCINTSSIDRYISPDILFILDSYKIDIF